MLRDRVAHPGQADLVVHLGLRVVVQQARQGLQVPVDRLVRQALAVQGLAVRAGRPVPQDQAVHQGHQARQEREVQVRQVHLDPVDLLGLLVQARLAHQVQVVLQGHWDLQE